MAGPYAEVGARLIERGYAALPIIPGTKRPGHMRGGEWFGLPEWQSRYVARRPSHFESEHWSASDAGVCVVTGPASGDLVAIDIDSDDPEVHAAICACLPYTPVRKKGAKGETQFFSGPGVPSRSFNRLDAQANIVSRLCDVIGPGRQTVLPPSLHSDTGKPYLWTGEEALDAVAPHDLPIIGPEIVEAIGEALKPFGYRLQPARVVVNGERDDETTPHRALNDLALANLDLWVPKLRLYRCRSARGGYEAVPLWRASSTGKPLEKRKLNLKIHPSGIRDMGADQSYTALDLVREACDCDLDTAFANLAHWLGTVPDAPIVLAEPIVFETRVALPSLARNVVVVGGVTADAETGEVIASAESGTAAGGEPGSVEVASGESVPAGVIGEIVAWILSVSRRPQPRFAVAAALSLVGTLASRQMVTPTFAPLNLYMLTIGRSGYGKDAPLKAIKSALSAAGMADLIGPDGLQSNVAVYDLLNRRPVSILPVDEFGDFLAALSGPKAPPHVANVMAALRKAWDSGMMPTPHAASRPGQILYNPCMTLYCASTPEQFYDSVGRAQALNGFLNRFLVVHVQGNVARSNAASIEDVPDNVIAALKTIAERPGGNNFGRFMAGPAQHPLRDKPFVISWADSAARNRWESYEAHYLDASATNAKLDMFAQRCAQNALRVASALAVSDDILEPRLTLANLDWAINFVDRSLADMIAGYDSHVPQSESAILAERVIDFIKSNGGSASRRDLFRGPLQRRVKRVQDVDDVMKILIEGGEIEESKTVPATGGPVRISYRNSSL